jgi:hypothetical protein
MLARLLDLLGRQLALWTVGSQHELLEPKLELDEWRDGKGMRSRLAPHAVTIPGIIIAIDVDDRTDDEIKMIQEKG